MQVKNLVLQCHVGHQFIDGLSCFCKKSLILQKCRHPKKPRDADSGLGCADDSTRFFGLVNNSRYFPACAPQSTKTMPLFSFKHEITARVKVSHPSSACDRGEPCRTVRQVFKSKTPWCAHGVKSPSSTAQVPKHARTS